MGIFSRRLKNNPSDSDSTVISISNLSIPKVSERKFFSGILTNSKNGSREKDSPKVHNETNISRFPDYAIRTEALNGSTKRANGSNSTASSSSVNSEYINGVSSSHAHGRRTHMNPKYYASENKHSPRTMHHSTSVSNTREEDGEEEDYDLTLLSSSSSSHIRRRWSLSSANEPPPALKTNHRSDSIESIPFVSYYLSDPSAGQPVWNGTTQSESSSEEMIRNGNRIGSRNGHTRGDSVPGFNQSLSSCNLSQLQNECNDGYRHFKSGELNYGGVNIELLNSISGDYSNEFDHDQPQHPHPIWSKSPKGHGSIRDVFNSLGYERTTSFQKPSFQNDSEISESSSPGTEVYPALSVSRSNSKSRSKAIMHEVNNGVYREGSDSPSASMGHYSARTNAQLEAVFNHDFMHVNGLSSSEASSNVERSLRRSESEHPKPPSSLIIPPTPFTPPATKSTLSPGDRSTKLNAKEGKDQGFSAKSWVESLFTRRKSIQEKAVVKFIDASKTDEKQNPSQQHRRRSMDSVAQALNKPNRKHHSHNRRHSQDDGRGPSLETNQQFLNQSDRKKATDSGRKGEASSLWSDINKLWADQDKNNVESNPTDDKYGMRLKMDDNPGIRRRSLPNRPNRFPDAEPSPLSSPTPTVLFELLNILHKPLCDVNEQYWIQEDVLGRGRYGVIRLCFSKATGEALACKTITKANLRWQDIEDVRKEVMVMELLKGISNVIQLKGSFEDVQSVHIVMEMCDGGELFDRIKLRHHYSEQDAAKVCQTLTRVIQKCHSRGVMHRDLKPENILLRSMHSDTDLAVIDFGLATFFKKGKYCNGIVGTPSYCAPEVLRGYYGPEADVWSMGVILYILLCGYPPFPGSTIKDFMEFFSLGKWQLNGKLLETISEEAKDLVLKMLVFEPEKRITPSKVLEHPWIVACTRK